jgi:hypothetical protein
MHAVVKLETKNLKKWPADKNWSTQSTEKSKDPKKHSKLYFLGNAVVYYILLGNLSAIR